MSYIVKINNHKTFIMSYFDMKTCRGDLKKFAEMIFGIGSKLGISDIEPPTTAPYNEHYYTIVGYVSAHSTGPIVPVIMPKENNHA